VYNQILYLMLKRISYLILSLLLTNCSHYVLSSTGYTRPPEKYKFPYSKHTKKLHTNQIIDTTAIYYLHDSYFTSGDGNHEIKKYKRTDAFIRFYDDGRLKIQSSRGEYPKIEDINNINNGIVGYYLLKGNQIKIQVYSDIDAGSNQLKYGYIDENKNLIIYDANPRTYISIFNLFSEQNGRKKMEKAYYGKKEYKKIKVEGIIYEKPNW